METVEAIQLNDSVKELLRLAVEAQSHSYSPYSKFKVGCALSDSSGAFHTGCNVENVNFSETICAERTAITKMVSEGGKKIEALLIVTPTKQPVFPCGSCLQVINEFGADADVYTVEMTGKKIRKAKLRELLPQGFSPEHLQK